MSLQYCFKNFDYNFLSIIFSVVMPKPEEIAKQLLDQKASLNVDGLLVSFLDNFV